MDEKEKQGMSKEIPNQQDGLKIVRDLLIGQEFSEYHKEIETLKTEIHEIKKHMVNSFDVLKESLASIKNANEDTQKEMYSQMEKFEAKFQTLLKGTQEQLVRKIDRINAESTNRLQLADFLSDLAARVRDGEANEKDIVNGRLETVHNN